MKTLKYFLIFPAMALLNNCTSLPAQAGEAKSISDNPLSFMYGEWTGTAIGSSRNGEAYTVRQTERVGTMLDGQITVIGGKGFDADDVAVFDAFAVISLDKRTQKWEIRSYADGYAGTFEFEPKSDGFIWSTPAGPGTTMRYSATIKNDEWHQIGELLSAEGNTRKIFEMNLTRTGPTDWPNGASD